MSYCIGLYRDDIAPDDVEGLLYRIGDLAAVGVCAADSTMNIDVLPKLQALFEVIHKMSNEAHEKLEQQICDQREEKTALNAKA